MVKNTERSDVKYFFSNDSYFMYILFYQDDKDEYCDSVAKKCKAGDKKACEMYKKKCGKVVFYRI